MVFAPNDEAQRSTARDVVAGGRFAGAPGSMFLLFDFGNIRNIPPAPTAIDAAQNITEPTLDGGVPNGSLSSAIFVPTGSIIAMRLTKKNTNAVMQMKAPEITLRILIFESSSNE